MDDIKDIIIKKTHQTSLNKLKKESFPPSLNKFIDILFLNKIALTLSKITRDTFIYTGKLTQEKESLVVSFTSSNQKDVIDMVMRYDYSSEDGFEFKKLNTKLEKTLDKETPKQKIDPVKLIKKLEKDSKTVDVKPKVVKKTTAPIDGSKLLEKLEKERKAINSKPLDAKLLLKKLETETKKDAPIANNLLKILEHEIETDNIIKEEKKKKLQKTQEFLDRLLQDDNKDSND